MHQDSSKIGGALGQGDSDTFFFIVRCKPGAGCFPPLLGLATNGESPPSFNFHDLHTLATLYHINTLGY